MPKPPSWNEIRVNAAAFAQRWSEDVDENAGAQMFWRDFLAVFGVDVKRVGTFEARATRTSTGGRGRIDLLWPGILAAEHKSAGKDLEAAEAQAIDYIDSLDGDRFPGVVLASDFAHIRIRDLGGDNVPFTFALKDLVKEIDRFGFIAGYKRRDFSTTQEEQANIKAARLMGRLYEQLSKNGYEGHDASVFLTRLLFLLFGDDTGMWEKGLFSEYLETRTHKDGSDTGGQLAVLFKILDKPEASRSSAVDELLRRFPYVNGGLFKDRIDIPDFDHEMRDELVTCADFDWGSISPAIFGSMFQAVKSKEARRELGEHYTTEMNILKVIRPLFLDDLQEQFEAARNSKIKLAKLRTKLGTLRYMDPACGCGNFLVVAYRELRALELDILRRLRDLSPDEQQLSLDPTLGLQVSLDQFFGIEIEEWPARIAETAMFLVDHQANLALAEEFGVAPDRLPIDTSASIDIGNAVQTKWGDVLPAGDDVFIFGNPPFIGMSRMSSEQQEDNRTAFTSVNSKGLRTGRLDYVACWYVKAMTYMQGTRARAAFVSTNSISQGEQARTLEPLLARHGFAIDFAHRTFKWTSEAPSAAVVHVIVIGFSEGGQAKVKRLFDYPTLAGQPIEVTAKRINAYLVDYDGPVPDKLTSPLLSGLPNASKGSQPTDGGFLTVEVEDYAKVMADPLAAKYLRPYRQSTAMLYNLDRWCLWLVGAAPSDIKNSPVLQERLKGVAESRLKSKTASVKAQAKTPALFTQIRQPSGRYFALPEVSTENRDYIPGRFYDTEVIAGNKLICIPDPPLWVVGFLQSAAFSAWVKTFAGRMKSDPSLSASTVYFTFPFVDPGKVKDKFADAMQAVLDARDMYPSECLATLYDRSAMPPELRQAHERLDLLVDGLYKLKNPTQGQRLTAMLREYNQLAAPLEAAAKSPNRRR